MKNTLNGQGELEVTMIDVWNYGGFLYWFIVVYGAAFVLEKISDGVIDARADHYTDRRAYRRYRRLVNGIAVIIFTIILFSPLYYEFPKRMVYLNHGARVATIENDTISYHQFGTFEWPWENKTVLNLYPREVTRETTLMAQNESGKFGKVTYQVTVFIPDLEEFYRDEETRNLAHFSDFLHKDFLEMFHVKIGARRLAKYPGFIITKSTLLALENAIAAGTPPHTAFVHSIKFVPYEEIVPPLTQTAP